MTPQQCLAFWPNSSLKRWQELYAKFGSDQAWWDAGINAVRHLNWSEVAKASFMTWRQNASPERFVEVLQRCASTLVTYGTREYPRPLTELTEPPLGLFMRGQPLNGLMLAAVGTRRPSPYGRQAAAILIPPLARAGLTIVSGLAYGIDALCHTLTLRTDGSTVAVLGSGVDHQAVQPVANQALAEQIVANGGTIVSEYPPGTLATNFSFPLRNRIIAGLCSATLVIEAPQKSGALITAQVAADLQRPVACVPHPITSEHGAGSNRWLSQEGALIVTDVADVLLLYPGLVKSKAPINLTTNPAELALLELIPVGGKHINLLVQEFKQPASTTLSLISQLELQNIIVDLGGQHYARRT